MARIARALCLAFLLLALVPASGASALITTITLLRAVSLGFTQISPSDPPQITESLEGPFVVSNPGGLTQSAVALVFDTSFIPATDVIISFRLHVGGELHSDTLMSLIGCISIVGTSCDTYELGQAILSGITPAGDLGFETYVELQHSSDIPGEVDQSNFDTELLDSEFLASEDTLPFGQTFVALADADASQTFVVDPQSVLLTITTVPEPATGLLVAAGLASLAVARRSANGLPRGLRSGRSSDDSPDIGEGSLREGQACARSSLQQRRAERGVARPARRSS
jgi:hypothetical protein